MWLQGRWEGIQRREEGGEEGRRGERKRMKVAVGNKQEREDKVNKNPGLFPVTKSLYLFDSIIEAFSQILNISPKE